MRKEKKGQATQYILFFSLAFVIILIAAIFAPMGIQFNLKMYEAGENIIDNAIDDVANINDATVRNQINSTLQSSLGAAENNINVNSNIFQWGWVAVVIVFFITLFIITRRQVEIQNNGFV